MASILRSGKILRYFTNLTRSVIFQPTRASDTYFLQHPHCSCFASGFTTSAPKAEVNLDRHIKRLDQDVRRIGRISRRDIEEVLDEIRLHRSATSSQSLLVIRCCGNLVPEELPEVRTALVQEIWKTLNALNIPMDISHYNALLRVYLENEYAFSPDEILAELESKAIEPNRVTHQRLILRYCQQGDIDGATKILEVMKEKGLPVNEGVFNALILGHSQANDIESAKSILTVMKQAGLEPSADTYATLLCCYARNGDIESVLRTIDECEKNETFLLDKDILDAVYALTVNGHQDKVDPVLAKLRKFAGFNGEAVNVILRLVNKGHDDVAIKILKEMPRGSRVDGQPVDAGIFFIRHLVKVNRPIEHILNICKNLHDDGLNPKALLIAAEASLLNANKSVAFPLFKAMKSSGFPIRQHYFWPFLCKSSGPQALDILQQMRNEFEVIPNSETIREYVIPRFHDNRSEHILMSLINAGISSGTAASATLFHALSKNKIQEAVDIAESYRAHYSPLLFRPPLVQALETTRDFDSFIKIVRQIHDNLNGDNQAGEAVTLSEGVEESETDSVQRQIDTPSNRRQNFIGQIIQDVAVHFRNETETIETILNLFVAQGLSITNTAATRIQDRLGSGMTLTISELLGRLASGELEPSVIQNNKRKRSLDTLSVDQLERFISNQEAKGENTKNLKRHLITNCFKSKNLTKALEVIDRLEKENFQISSGIWAQLIDLYAQQNHLDKAMELYEKIKSKEIDFLLDNNKTISLVEQLLKSNKFDDAIKFLERNKKPSMEDDGESSFNYTTSCWRLLNSLAESKDADKLETMFNALVDNNYILPSNVLLGPHIKVQLLRDDIPKAMETFEKIAETYKCTPFKNELARQLIQKEDATNLQKLTDISTNIHGEVNSLYDLVLSFIECGRIRQARKILETPGLQTRPKRIDLACERYKNEGKVEPLEGLIEATKDLNHIDRSPLYYNLLLSYCKKDDPEKALGLWTRLQEESLPPTDAFLETLASFLKSKNMDVPFVEPSLKSDTKVQRVDNQQTHATNQEQLHLSKLRQALKEGEIDSVLAMMRALPVGQQLSLMDLSHLIENMARAGRLVEATRHIFELLHQNRRPIPRVFKFYLNKIASTGDTETMERIGELLTPEQKKVISFDNRYCHANIVAGKSEQYLKKLYDQISAAKTDDEIALEASKFPRGGALGILESSPELVPQFQKLAETFAEKKHIGAINILWIYHFISSNEAAAKAIWDKYLVDQPRLMFQRILQIARINNDEKLASKLVDFIKDAKISEGGIGNAYSCLIDLQCSNNKYDQALETLNAALKKVGSIENINSTAVSRLKAGLEGSGKEFPHKIPSEKGENKTGKPGDKGKDKSSSSSSSSSSCGSSSSSSDDDIKKKKSN